MGHMGGEFCLILQAVLSTCVQKILEPRTTNFEIFGDRKMALPQEVLPVVE